MRIHRKLERGVASKHKFKKLVFLAGSICKVGFPIYGMSGKRKTKRAQNDIWSLKTVNFLNRYSI